MQLNRRSFLAMSTALVPAAACGPGNHADNRVFPAQWAPPEYMPAILATEAARKKSGNTEVWRLELKRDRVDLGGIIVNTLTYNGTIPGPLLRANRGDEVQAMVTNNLSSPTLVHWHGLSVRCDADGAYGVNHAIVQGDSQTIHFTVTEPGTFWTHVHQGLDEDYGMYAPIIIDDPSEQLRYDDEWIVILDDWTHGVGLNPSKIFQNLLQGDMVDARKTGSDKHTGPFIPGDEPMDHMPETPDLSSSTDTLGTDARGSTMVKDERSFAGDAGDIYYPYYLINGRIPAAPSTFSAKPGQRIRLRIINAAADTVFTVALASHALTVTHLDGFPVTHTEVDSIIIGMGERYDAIFTAGDGVFPLVARAEAKNDIARALLVSRSAGASGAGGAGGAGAGFGPGSGAGGAGFGSGAMPPIAFRPKELGGRKYQYHQFKGVDPAIDVRSAQPVDFKLTGSMRAYDWAINGYRFPDFMSTPINQNNLIKVNYINDTMMWHPMHLHGHRMLLPAAQGTMVNKDTVMVPPKSTVSGYIRANNPGQWLVHCHNTYHMDAGMMSRMDYRV